MSRPSLAARITAALRLSGTRTRGAPPKNANARTWQSIQVRTDWSNTTRARRWRLCPSTITKTQARRASPLAGSTTSPTYPKSICPTSPGGVSTRMTTSSARGGAFSRSRRQCRLTAS